MLAIGSHKAGDTGELCLMDVRSGQVVKDSTQPYLSVTYRHHFGGHILDDFPVAFHSTKPLLAWKRRSGDWSIALWNYETGESWRLLLDGIDDRDSTWRIAFRPGSASDMLFALEEDPESFSVRASSLHIWDVKTKARIPADMLFDAKCFDLSGDGMYAATYHHYVAGPCGSSGVIRIFSIDMDKVLHEIDTQLTKEEAGHVAIIRFVRDRQVSALYRSGHDLRLRQWFLTCRPDDGDDTQANDSPHTEYSSGAWSDSEYDDSSDSLCGAYTG